MDDTKNWSELGAAVKSRRNELRLTQADVQMQGGPSTALLRQIENGRLPGGLSQRIRQSLDSVLGWEPGTVDRVLAGSQPSEGEALPGVDAVDVRPISFDIAEALVETLAAAGYALVKLPEMVVDHDGFETWPVEQKYAEGTVRIRQTDGRIDITSVFTPFENPEHALSLAAALIAAAQHAQGVA